VELGLGVIAASLATLRPLFRQFFRTASDNRNGSSRPSQSASVPSSWRRRFMTFSQKSSASSKDTLRKSKIGWPLTYGTETTITVGSGRTPVVGYGVKKDMEWGVEDIEIEKFLNGPEDYEARAFGVLGSLPKIPVRTYKTPMELKSLRSIQKHDRRHSAPS